MSLKDVENLLSRYVRLGALIVPPELSDRISFHNGLLCVTVEPEELETGWLDLGRKTA